MTTVDFWHYAERISRNGNLRVVRTKLPVRVVNDSRWRVPGAWEKLLYDAAKAAGLDADDCVIKLGDTRAKSERPITVLRVQFGHAIGPIKYDLMSQVVDNRCRGAAEKQRKQRQAAQQVSA